MEKHQRPISPFMLGSGYKLQQTSVMSFLHRLTGIASLIVLIVVGFWLLSIPVSQHLFMKIQRFITHPLFFPILAVSVASTVYHFCNGIRHLFWDVGIGITNEAAEKSGRMVLIATGVITVVLLAIGIFTK